MSNLITLNKENALQVFLSDDLDRFLNDIKNQAEELKPDISTVAGRKEIASNAYKVAQKKVEIDNIGKELVADKKKEISLVDNARKKARDFLDSLKESIRQPLTIWEEEEAEKERKRIELEQLAIAQEEAIKENELFDRIKEIERKEAELKAAEYARIAKDQADKEEKDRIEREKKIAEDAKIKAEKEAQQAIEDAKRAKIEAEINAQKEREDALERERQAAIKAEIEKQKAIEQAKKEEQDRIAAIEREQQAKLKAIEEENAKKAANINHQKKINNEALADFIKNGITEQNAKNIIILIAKKAIRNITINY